MDGTAVSRLLAAGRAELHGLHAESRALLGSVALFSAVANLLALTGPLFMLQVYDRVMSARSTETLLALFVLVLVLFAAMGALDHARSHVMRRIGARFQSRAEARIFSAALHRDGMRPGDTLAQTALRDLDAVRVLLGAPVFLALFDLPWALIFLGAIFTFHSWLGWLAVAGGALLIAMTALHQRLTAPRLATAMHEQIAAERLSDQLRDEGELIGALGMRGAAFLRWRTARRLASGAALSAADLGETFSIFSRTFRMFLQSAMLALGALVVLRGEMSAGAMIAGSILMGRALAPVEQLIACWPIVQHGRAGLLRLSELLGRVPPEAPRTPLPRPRARIEAHALTVAPPGAPAPTLRMVSFTLEPGQAMGVIGPSGSGKSTLARALCGIWPPIGGTIRLDGATLAQYDPDVLGRMIGYLPQRVSLFDGTIAENISRLAPDAEPDRIIAAARRADAHRMILALPEGYDTRVTQAGGRLSGGQIQRIGLARALYGEPVLLILDEPNANLDHEGGEALNTAIRTVKASGGAVIVMAHRPAAIAECDSLLVLEGGVCRAFGPRDRVLASVLCNAGDLVSPHPAGGPP